MKKEGYSLVPHSPQVNSVKPVNPAKPVKPLAFWPLVIQWIAKCAAVLRAWGWYLLRLVFGSAKTNHDSNPAPIPLQCTCTKQFNAIERYTRNPQVSLCPVHGWKRGPTSLIKRGNIVSFC
jgi:hypothetical protein